MDVRVTDVHTGETAREARAFFAKTILRIQAMGKRVIVEGGWAVLAHGSPIPSIDIDLVVDDADFEDRDFYDFLHAEGAHRNNRNPTDPSLDVQLLGEENRLWASSNGYKRRDLLEGRTQTKHFQLENEGPVTVEVPSPTALTFMKLKAFRDRDLSYRLSHNPTLLTSYDVHEQDAVRSKPSDYWLRKAAKDLSDIALLWGGMTRQDRSELRMLLEQHGMRKAIEKGLREAADAVLNEATYLTRKHRLQPMPADAVSELLATLAPGTKPGG